MRKLDNVKIETAVLSSVLVNPLEFKHLCLDTLTPEMFASPTNKVLLQAILNCWAGGISPNPFDVERYWQALDSKQADALGGQTYLYQISQSATYKQDQLRGWINELAELAGLRKVSSTIADVKAAILTQDASLDSAITSLEGLSKKIYSSGAGSAISLNAEQIAKRDATTPAAEYLEHGEAVLDHMYSRCGSRRGQYEIIMGLTGHGKSHFAMCRAVQYLSMGYKILWAQREDTDSSTITRARAYANYIGIDPLALNNLYVSDRLKYISDIKREARLRHAEGNLDVLVVDYIQRVQAVGFRPAERRSIVDYISAELAELALELNILVLAVSQLSRRKIDRGWKLKPRLEDLKESSQLEQDAFVVSSVFNPSRIDELRLPERNQVEWEDGQPQPANLAQIEFLKHRHGLAPTYKQPAEFSSSGCLRVKSIGFINAKHLDQHTEPQQSWYDNL